MEGVSGLQFSDCIDLSDPPQAAGVACCGLSQDLLFVHISYARTPSVHAMCLLH